MSSIFEELDMAGTFTQHLGEEVIYDRAGVQTTIAGIPELPAQLATAQSDYAPESVEVRASVSVQAADLPAGHVTGDPVTIRGQLYRVKAFLPDGRGMVVCLLEKAA